MEGEKPQASKGQCFVCRGTFGKRAMTRHLAKCLDTEASKSGSDAPIPPVPAFHLIVDGYKTYWLHLLIRQDATLEELDRYLRNIWLECCWHLSAFRFGDRHRLSSDSFDDLDIVLMDDEPKIDLLEGDPEVDSSHDVLDIDLLDDDPEEDGMDVTLAVALEPGMTFTHEYDFGSTTELKLKVAAAREGRLTEKEPIRLLARNDPPVFFCHACGQPATQLCPQCEWKGNGYLCETCAPKHECGDEMLLPVVNSPRMGVCGYTG